jgi:hypothetical protein
VRTFVVRRRETKHRITEVASELQKKAEIDSTVDLIQWARQVARERANELGTGEGREDEDVALIIAARSAVDIRAIRDHLSEDTAQASRHTSRDW